MKNNSTTKKSFLKMTKATKIGTYNFFVMLVLLAIVVFVNLAVMALPKTATHYDMTDTGMMSVSDSSVNFASDIDEDITIYFLCDGGESDKSFELFLRHYFDSNKHISLEIVDPVKNPDFTSKYTDSALDNYSVIVESARRAQVITVSDLYCYSSEATGKISSDQYEEMYSMYNQYYTYYGIDYFKQVYGFDFTSIVPYFQGETALTGALEYVTLETIPHAYIIEGHGETALPSDVTDFLTENNFTSEALNIDKSGKIPDDASTLVIVAPSSDISATEAPLLSDYLKGGGSLMLISAPGCEKYTNLLSVLSEYGMSALPGTVYDPSSGAHSANAMHELLPTLDTSHFVTSYLTKYTMTLPHSHAVGITDKLPENVTVTQLLTTSSSAYRTDGENKLGKDGKLCVGAAAENSKTGAQIVWLPSAEAFANKNYVLTGGNLGLVVYSLAWMSRTYASALPELPNVALQSNMLSVPAGSITLWMIILAIVIPVAAVVTGLVIWLRRRKK